MLPLITIQILNWNRAEETLRAINSALNQTYNNIEIVVIDNGSTDKSVELIKKNYPAVTLIELDKNYGCPGGRNKGIPYCSGKFIFYLDNDGVLHKDAVKNAYTTFLEDEDIGIVTGKLYNFEHESEIDAECEIKSIDRYYYNNFQGGICMHLKEIYKHIGLYPEHFMYGAEEHFLSIKMFASNYKIVKDESVILWHKKSSMARDMTNETLSAYYNKLYVALACYPAIYAVLFTLAFPFKYYFHSKDENLKHKYLSSFSSRYFSTIIKALKYRSAVPTNAYTLFKRQSKLSF